MLALFKQSGMLLFLFSDNARSHLQDPSRNSHMVGFTIVSIRQRIERFYGCEVL